MSPPPRDTLDLGSREPTAAEREENWRRILAPRLPPRALALVDQVHGDRVVVVEGPRGPHEAVAQADAMITSVRGIALGIRVADCVPVLLAAPGAVGAVHAGWRGVAAGIAPRTVERLCRLAGCEAAQVVAAVGPRISGARYEVGPEVIEALRASGLDDADFRDGERNVDLGRAVRAQLARVGVVEVDVLDACTSGEAFYSHRFDGPGTGRQAGWVALC